PAPDLRPGAVIAVLGADEDALRAGAQLLLAAGGRPGRLALVGAERALPATGVRITNPRRASRLRAAARRDPVVVAVPAPTTRRQRRLTEEVLAALAPDQIWAAIDARTAAVDVAAWLAALPVPRVDAVTVQRVREA